LFGNVIFNNWHDVHAGFLCLGPQ